MRRGCSDDGDDEVETVDSEATVTAEDEPESPKAPAGSPADMEGQSAAALIRAPCPEPCDTHEAWCLCCLCQDKECLCLVAAGYTARFVREHGRYPCRYPFQYVNQWITTIWAMSRIAKA